MWKTEFGVDIPLVVALFAAENDPDKQDFLCHQFPDLAIVFDNVTAFDLEESGPLVKNIVTSAYIPVPRTPVFGGGFSCKAASKQNNNRKKLTGCVMNEVDSTGYTYRFIKSCPLRRPRVDCGSLGSEIPTRCLCCRNISSARCFRSLM